MPAAVCTRSQRYNLGRVVTELLGAWPGGGMFLGLALVGTKNTTKTESHYGRPFATSGAPVPEYF